MWSLTEWGLSMFDKQLAFKGNVTITSLEVQLYAQNIKVFIECKQ